MDTHDSPAPSPDDAANALHDAPAPPPGTLARAIPLRPRHDGWTPERQHDFITALAKTGCVAEAARSVGMSPRSAYTLRARAEANIFR